jgi:hypothetical protein
MNEKTRGSGDALVRVNPEAVSKAYADLGSEDDVQARLADELRSCGWTVIREAHCRPASGKARRIDLYCVAPDWFGNPHAGIATGKDYRDAIRPGFILGIECKHQHGTSQDIDAYIQCRRYVSASVWADGDGVPLAKPDWFATCSTSNLTGQGWHGSQRVWKKPNDHVRRIMWRDGCDVLHRQRDGSLYVSIRVPRIIENQGRKVFTTNDREVPLTLWTDCARYLDGGAP